MSIRNGKSVTSIPGIHIRTKDKLHDAVLEFSAVNTAPTTATGYYYLYVSGTSLIYDDGSTTHNITSGGGGVTTWDALYLLDKTLTVNSTTLTFAGTHATGDVFTVTNATGSGDCIQITNSGTGYDIEGTSGLWYVAKTGDADFLSATVGGGSANGVVTSSGAYDLVLETNDGTNSSTITITDGANGAITFAMNGTGGVVISGTTEASTGFQLTNGDAVISDGSLTITDDDNAATLSITSTATLTNSLITIVADSATTGKIIDVNADGLTEGTILHLDTSSSGLTTGLYIDCYDGAASDFSVAADGAVTIAGSAMGTAAFSMTAGDIVMTDGNVSITSTATTQNAVDISAASTTTGTLLDISDADALTSGGIANFTSNSSDTTARYLVYVKNDNAAATGAILFGGVNDSTGTSVFIDHNGVTGKSVYIDAETTTESGGIVDISPAALTTGTVVDIGDADVITTGKVINIASSSGAATSADFVKIAHAGSSATLADRTGSILDLSSSLTTTRTSGTSALDYDAVSITRTSVMNGAGGTMTSAGSVLYVQNTATQTAGTLGDTTNAIEVVMTGGAEAQGYGLSITHTGTTVGAAIYVAASQTTANIVDISAAALTEGKGIDLSDLDAITTGKAIHVDATGNTHTTGILVHIDSGSGVIAGAGRLFLSAHTGTAGTTAVLNEFSTASTADEQLLRLTASGALAAGVMLDFSAAAVTTATIIDMSALTAFTTGKAIHIDADGATHTTGILVHVDSDGTAITGAGRLLLVDHTGATTTSGTIAEIKTSAADETILLELDGASLTSGKCLNVVGTALTTGSAVYIDGIDALTSGDLMYLNSDSADVSARALIKMHNDNTAAVGCVPIEIVQDAVISTNFKQVLNLAGQVIYVSDGTTPNGNLSGAAGNLCIGADSGKSYYCTGTTNWTAL